MRGQDLSGDVLDRRYQIVERIAEGAMGVVYRGLRIKLDRAVAIKVMHTALPGSMEGRKRFDREAKVMARLEHPHCVSIIDYGIHAEKPYVVMELLRGRSLYEILAEHGRFEMARAVDILCQVLSGLAHAHEQGIIHRDIKPANLMITPKAPLGVHARILDFGLARMLGASASLSHGVAVGTPSYMAPEQCRGDLVDARADLYSCGVVLFEMLTGKKPFVASDPIAIVKKQLEQMPPLLADIRPDDYGALEDVVARALAKSPADRFPTAVAMAEALDAALTGRGGSEATTALPHHGSTMVAPIEPSIDIPITIGSSTRIVTEARATPTPGQESGEGDAAKGRPSPESSERDTSMLRKMLPVSRMRYVVIVPLVLAAAAIAGVLAARLDTDPQAKAQLPVQPVVAIAPDDAAVDPVGELVATATHLEESGKLDLAIDLLLKARPRYPDRAIVPLHLGKLYFAKLWWNDGLTNLREALRLDPQLRSDPELLKTALRGFVTTPAYDWRLARLLVDLGPAMVPLLETTSRSHHNAEIRARCAAVLRRMPRIP